METLTTLLAPAQAGPSFWMPQQASEHAANVDGLFYFIYILCVVFFVLTMGAMLLFMVRYRRRSKDQKTSPIEGNTRLEIAWAVIPTILLIAMFFWGFRDFMALNVPPADGIDVRVNAQKWSWSFSYPKHGIDGTGELIVPVNTPVKLAMSSVDVIHSFYVPALRIKRDVLPNRYTSLHFTATRTGTFQVFCTEYCGDGHSRMLSKLRVVSQAEFDGWVDRGGLPKGMTGPKLGEFLFKQKACNTCHSTDGNRKGLPGPPLGGKYGTIEQLSTGASVKVDDNYIRESIMNPNAKVVKGFSPVMPTFAGQLDDKKINAIIDYIKTMKK